MQNSLIFPNPDKTSVVIPTGKPLLGEPVKDCLVTSIQCMLQDVEAVGSELPVAGILEYINSSEGAKARGGRLNALLASVVDEDMAFFLDLGFYQNSF